MRGLAMFLSFPPCDQRKSKVFLHHPIPWKGSLRPQLVDFFYKCFLCHVLEGDFTLTGAEWNQQNVDQRNKNTGATPSTPSLEKAHWDPTSCFFFSIIFCVMFLRVTLNYHYGSLLKSYLKVRNGTSKVSLKYWSHIQVWKTSNSLSFSWFLTQLAFQVL